MPEVHVDGNDTAVILQGPYHGELSGIPEVLGPLLRIGGAGAINNA